MASSLISEVIRSGTPYWDIHIAAEILPIFPQIRGEYPSQKPYNTAPDELLPPPVGSTTFIFLKTVIRFFGEK